VFGDLRIVDDPMTAILLGLILLLVGLPGILLTLRVVSRPPLGIRRLRWLYLAWACLLAASSVWSLSRDPLLSADDAGTNNFVRLGFLLLGALIMSFIGARRGSELLRELGSGVLGIFSVFALWSLMSTLWSVSPAGTLYKSIEYSTMLALFALVASSIMVAIKDPRDRMLALKSIFDWHWFLLFLFMMSVYAGVLFLPEYAVLRDYRDQSGVLGFSIQGALPGLSANAVGTLGAILGIVALVRILAKPRSKMLWSFIFVASLLTMVLTQSRSPILAFSVAAAVVLIASRRFGILAFGAVLGAVALLTSFGQPIYEFMARGQNAGDIASLTGRVSYWEDAFQAIRDKPLLGYGANAGGKFVLESALGEAVSTVHSLYVEVLLDTGAIGLTLLLAGVAATWFWMLKARRIVAKDPIGSLLWLESLGVLTVLSVRSIFAVTLVWSWYVLNFGVILIFISVARRQVAQARHAGAALAQPLSATRRRRSSIRG
jgi:O-antigen ligase